MAISNHRKVAYLPTSAVIFGTVLPGNFTLGSAFHGDHTYWLNAQGRERLVRVPLPQTQVDPAGGELLRTRRDCSTPLRYLEGTRKGIVTVPYTDVHT
jgi:hypothetical protein